MKLALKTAALIAAILTETTAMARPAETLFSLETPIAAPDGRWDFASWDSEHHRVIISHGADVLIVDPRYPDALRAIGQIEGAHAALSIPGTNLILVTSAHDNSARILDATSGGEIARMAVAADPDATVLSADGHTAYVMGAKDGEISVINLDHPAETARIQVKPGLEVPVLFGEHMLAVNDEDAGEIEIVDLAAGRLTSKIAMPGCEGPTGLAHAPQFGLALSACANGKAMLVDLAHRKVIRSLAIGLGPDTVIWDASHGRFLVPCGKSGTLSMIGLNRHGARILPQVPTETSARTAALDPASGRVYLPAARFQAAEPGKRPEMIPGSFHLVVLAPRTVGH